MTRNGQIGARWGSRCKTREARWAEDIEELKFRMECGSKETGVRVERRQGPDPQGIKRC